MKTIAFFNNKGGVGKTTLVYHLAWMMSLLGKTVVVADLDPQENATTMFLTEDEQNELLEVGGDTIVQFIHQALQEVHVESAKKAPIAIADRLFLIPGSLSLSNLEDKFSTAWQSARQGDEQGLLMTAVCSRVIRESAAAAAADVALIDLGPNFGAINRAALVAADYVIVPLAADLFAIQGLQSIGAKLRDWRSLWHESSCLKTVNQAFLPPSSAMDPLGYVVSRHSALASQSRFSSKWLDRIPDAYRSSILGQKGQPHLPIDNDPNKLALMKDYRSLMPLAQEARKPMFLLKPADGAIGGHQSAVQSCRLDFEELAKKILARASVGAKG